jgi:hypothetical protein
MKVEILIVSYAHDLPYLRYNLKSIYKFTHDFTGITVVVPALEADQFAALSMDYPCNVRPYARVEYQPQWHLDAQCRKCFADLYCPEADFVLHTDSDCIFTEPVGPEDYFVNGKPVMVIEPYAKMPYSPWKSVVEAVLKQPAPYETMRRHPQVNPIGIYRDLREHIQTLHGRDFTEYVLSLKPDFPWGFTEHNVIGSYALATSKWKDAYHWIDLGKEKMPKEKLMQFWSLSPVNKEQGAPHGAKVVPAQFAEKALK